MFHLTFEDNTGAEYCPRGNLEGTSLATLQSNVVTYQGDYVGDITSTTSNVEITNWTTFYAPFTVSLWVYLIPNSVGYKTIFRTSGYFTAARGFWYTIGFGNTTQPYEVCAFIRSNTTLFFNELSSAVHYLDNRWSHHTITWDGSNVRIYVDGQLTHSGTDTESMGAVGQDIYFFNVSGSSNLDGYSDDIRIYDYVLSPVEVEYLYTSTLVHKDQILHLSFDQSNTYDYHNFSANVTATGDGVYLQDPGSKVGSHSGKYPQTSPSGTLVPSIIGLTDNDAFTVSGWSFIKEEDGIHAFFSTKDYTVNSQAITVEINLNSFPTAYITAIYKNSSVRYRQATISNGSQLVNKWNHIVVVFTSTNAFVYLDGVKQTTASSGTMGLTLTDTSGAICVGGYNTTTTSEFNGAIDEFRVFNRDLLEAEIAAMYRAYTETRIYSLNAPSLVLESIPPVPLYDYTVDTVNTNNFSVTQPMISDDGLRTSGYNLPSGDLTIVRVGIQTLSTAHTVSTAGSVSWSSNYNRVNRIRCFTMIRDSSHADFGKKFWVGGDQSETSLFTTTTAWDLSSGSWSTVISANSSNPRSRWIDFSYDGMIFYMWNDTDQQLRGYNLSTAYDISGVSVNSPDITMSDFRTGLGISSGTIASIQWVNDGKYAFVIDSNGAVRLVNVTSNPYDITRLVERNIIVTDSTTFNFSGSEVGFFVDPTGFSSGSKGVVSQTPLVEVLQLKYLTSFNDK